jgi:hypothetical protein
MSTFNALSFSGNADVLARESSADEVHWLQLFRLYSSDVTVPPYLRPPLLQYSAAVLIHLHLPPALHTYQL